MVKKIIYMCSLLLCIFLIGCKGNDNETKKSDNPLVVETTQNNLLIYEANDVAVQLWTVDSYGFSGGKNYVFQLLNNREQAANIDISGLVINGKYAIDESYTIYAESYEDSIYTYDTAEEMTRTLYAEGVESIKSIRFHILVRDESHAVIDEQDIQLDLEEPLSPAMEYSNYLGGRAKEQILVDDEYAKVTLLALGKDPANKGSLTIVACVENKSQVAIPAKINGIKVNGVFVEIHGGIDSLEPSQRFYLTETVSSYEFEAAGIQEISELELLLETRNGQNEGIAYPVVLKEKSDAVSEFGTGELLDEIEDVCIYYKGQAEDKGVLYDNEYIWNLGIANESDENVTIAIVDVFLDDMTQKDWNEKHNVNKYALTSSLGKLATNSNSMAQISLGYNGEIKRPKLSFKIQIRSMDGESVIATSKKEITILPEE